MFACQDGKLVHVNFYIKKRYLQCGKAHYSTEGDHQHKGMLLPRGGEPRLQQCLGRWYMLKDLSKTLLRTSHSLSQLAFFSYYYVSLAQVGITHVPRCLHDVKRILFIRPGNLLALSVIQFCYSHLLWVPSVVDRVSLSTRIKIFLS